MPLCCADNIPGCGAGLKRSGALSGADTPEVTVQISHENHTRLKKNKDGEGDENYLEEDKV